MHKHARIRMLIAATALIAPATAAASLPAPTRAPVGLGWQVQATITAPTTGAYTLDSTYFQLGPDSWGRTRQTVDLTAGTTHKFAVRCVASRATYGYRLLGPGLIGQALWVKCQ